jgi:hypothetical protein
MRLSSDFIIAQFRKWNIQLYLIKYWLEIFVDVEQRSWRSGGVLAVDSPVCCSPIAVVFVVVAVTAVALDDDGAVIP